MATRYNICTNLLLAHVKEKKMFTTSVSLVYIGSRDADTKYSATGHDLEGVLKFKFWITVTILVGFVAVIKTHPLPPANHIMHLLSKPL